MICGARQVWGLGGGLVVGTILSDCHRLDTELGRVGLGVVHRAQATLLA
jgi:hypothetical protein